MRKIQLGLFGSDDDHCSNELYTLAYEVGRKLCADRVVLFTGGGKGVMEAASKGFYEVGGETVGILPGSNVMQANKYCTFVVPTGIGFARAQILANCVDAAIIVGGGGGTLIEMLECYWRKKSIVALVGSGGVADQYANCYLDERKIISIYSANSVDDAIFRSIELAREKINCEDVGDKLNW